MLLNNEKVCGELRWSATQKSWAFKFFFSTEMKSNEMKQTNILAQKLFRPFHQSEKLFISLKSFCANVFVVYFHLKILCFKFYPFFLHKQKPSSLKIFRLLPLSIHYYQALYIQSKHLVKIIVKINLFHQSEKLLC